MPEARAGGALRRLEAGGRAGARLGAGVRPPRPLVIAHRGASGHLPENTLPAYAAGGRAGRRHDRDRSAPHARRGGGDHARRGSAPGSAAAGRSRTPAWPRCARSTPGGASGCRCWRRCSTASDPRSRSTSSSSGARAPSTPASRPTPWPPSSSAACWRARSSPRSTTGCWRGCASSPAPRGSRCCSRRRARRIRSSARRRLGAEAINPWRGLVRRELVEAAHAAGLAVYVFTVDEVEEMERMLALGVDGLFTNYPDRMRACLRRIPAGDPVGIFRIEKGSRSHFIAICLTLGRMMPYKFGQEGRVA